MLHCSITLGSQVQPAHAGFTATQTTMAAQLTHSLTHSQYTVTGLTSLGTVLPGTKVWG